jgi:hypothetical protein
VTLNRAHRCTETARRLRGQSHKASNKATSEEHHHPQIPGQHVRNLEQQAQSHHKDIELTIAMTVHDDNDARHLLTELSHMYISCKGWLQAARIAIYAQEHAYSVQSSNSNLTWNTVRGKLGLFRDVFWVNLAGIFSEDGWMSKRGSLQQGLDVLRLCTHMYGPCVYVQKGWKLADCSVHGM